MRVVECVFKDRDNTNDLLLKADGVAVDLSVITKMELIGEEWSINSDDNPEAFDFSTGGGVVVLSLGFVPDIPTGRSKIDVIVYDPDNTSGINWGTFKIYVR